MAKIITFANQKGGTGKTQCTVLAAAALAGLNYKVLVIDADDQQSITTARQFDNPTPEAFKLITAPSEDLFNVLSEQDHHQHFIFIDLPGRLDMNLPIKDQRIIKALMYVDFLFIPFVSGNYNLESTLKFINAVKRVEALRADQARGIAVYGFINMYVKRSRLNDYLKQDIEAIEDKTGIPFMEVPLKRLTAFSEASTTESIYNPKARNEASFNFAQWFNELTNIIDYEKG